MRKLLANIIIISSLIVVAVQSPLRAGSFQWLLPIPAENGSYRPYLSALSPDGTAVVGSAILASYDTAYRWTETGGTQNLGNLGGTFPNSQASAASLGGMRVVGHASIHPHPYSLAYLWTEVSGMTELGDLPGGVLQSGAFGISRDGSVIVGQSSSEASGTSWTEAFRWTEATGMVGLGGLAIHPFGFLSSSANAISADGSVIAGNSWSGSGYEAFRWTEADGMVSLGDLPGGLVDGSARAASSDGSVIVGGSSSELSAPTSVAYEAFRWTQAGGTVGLGDLPGGRFHSMALGVSGDGSRVVGYSYAGGTTDTAFFWDAGGGMRTMASYLTAETGIDFTGCQLVNASGISEDGRVITGTGSCGNVGGVWVAVVPEPSVMALVMFPMIWVGLRRRRRID